MNQVIGSRYHIIEAIGAGGMGTVYRGVNTQTGQTVAVKHLKSDLTEPAIIARFKREGELLRALDHPNIVKLLDVIEEDQQHYLIIEFVAGGDLNQQLKHGKLAIEQVLRLAIDLADALTRAHKLDIIHRDLKPANVLLAADGTLQLTDFGIAHEGRRERVTDTGIIVGTVDYLSPEALNGEALDTRADIWAFGVMLFEMLTSQRPFSEKTVSATITRILTSTLPDLEALRPDAPVTLVDLVYRMLERDRAARIRSVRQVGLELEDLLHSRQLPVELKDRFSTPTPTVIGEKPKHNLPSFSSGFIGREDELNSLVRMIDLPGTRLVTILAPGGMGKTRLALQVAQYYADSLSGSHLFADGIYFIALAPLISPETIIPTIAETLGIQFSPGSSPERQLIDYLHERELLLVLDNFEHLLDGVQIVGEIAQKSPGVKMLVTSRERLNLSSETPFVLSGMGFPEWETPNDALAYGAVRLFMQSARQAKPDFELAADDLTYLARICRLVGGMPLGIVLTATWVNMLSLVEIATEVQQSLDFLETEMRDIPERQRSIRGVFDYSYNRLTSDEQVAFRRLSVFRGGFTREAAQSVAGASLKTLMTLMNKSLLRRDTTTGRYDIHELLRQYADNKLTTAGEQQAACQGHYDYFLKLAELAEAHAFGREQTAWFDRLETDFDNLRTALAWSVNSEAGLRLAAAMGWFFSERGHWLEGFDTLERTLAANPTAPSSLRAKASTKAAALTGLLGQQEQIRSTQALTLARDSGDLWTIAWALSDLSLALLVNANSSIESAALAAEESLTLFRALADPMGMAHTLIRRAWPALALEDYGTARLLLEEAAKLARDAGDKVILAWTSYDLGRICWLHDHDPIQAKSYFKTSVRHFRDAKSAVLSINPLIMLGQLEFAVGDLRQAQKQCEEVILTLKDRPYTVPLDIIHTLALLALIAWTAGQVDRASRLLAAADGLGLGDLDADRYVAITWTMGTSISRMRAELETAANSNAFAAGRAMSLKQVLAYALEG